MAARWVGDVGRSAGLGPAEPGRSGSSVSTHDDHALIGDIVIRSWALHTRAGHRPRSTPVRPHAGAVGARPAGVLARAVGSAAGPVATRGAGGRCRQRGAIVGGIGQGDADTLGPAPARAQGVRPGRWRESTQVGTGPCTDDRGPGRGGGRPLALGGPASDRGWGPIDSAPGRDRPGRRARAHAGLAGPHRTRRSRPPSCHPLRGSPQHMAADQLGAARSRRQPPAGDGAGGP